MKQQKTRYCWSADDDQVNLPHFIYIICNLLQITRFSFEDIKIIGFAGEVNGLAVCMNSHDQVLGTKQNNNNNNPILRNNIW